MPHYKNGMPAGVGDIVKGRGYNVPHEIIGKVLGIVEGSDACNLTVACIAKNSMVLRSIPEGSVNMGVQYSEVRATIEYGQADAFEKIA